MGSRTRKALWPDKLEDAFHQRLVGRLKTGWALGGKNLSKRMG